MAGAEDSQDGAPDVSLIVLEGMENPFQELETEAEQAGLRVACLERPPVEVRAGLDLMEATALAIALLSPAYNHLYQIWVDRYGRTWWKQLFDPRSPHRIRYQSLGSQRRRALEYSRVFSVSGRFRHGKVTLRFPEDCPEDHFVEGLATFIELLQAYEAGAAYNGIDLDAEDDCYWGTILLTYDAATSRLVVLNPFEGTLVQPEAIANQRRLEQERRGRASRSERPPSRIEPTVGPRRGDPRAPRTSQPSSGTGDPPEDRDDV